MFEQKFEWNEITVKEFFEWMRKQPCSCKTVEQFMIQFVSEKTKPVLFTTEDGVPVREGDLYFCVNTDLWSYWSATCNERTKVNLYVKTFSTENARNMYLYMNKPCLSLTEIFYNLNLQPQEKDFLTCYLKSKLKL
jgi:cytidine deaminase